MLGNTKTATQAPTTTQNTLTKTYQFRTITHTCKLFTMDSPSASAYLHQVSELNEDATYELSSGRPSLAITHLEAAAGRLVHCLSLPLANASPCSPHFTSRLQIPHLQDDLFYIYSCAVSYTVPTNTTTIPSHSDLVFELAVVLFNLALAHHQQGKMTKHEGVREASFQQALAYYKECQQALQSLDSNTNANEDDLLVLTLAVLNNQAQILYQHEHERQCQTDVFQKLMTHSMHAILREDDINLSMVEQSQIHEFVQNAMLFRLERPCAAPSA